jgi:hypothetical protein
MDEPNQIVPGNGPEPEAYDPSRDPKQKANSGDPGCKFCMKDVHGGIARFKRHLAGACTKGKNNSTKCMRVTEVVSKEMLEFLRAYAADDDEEDAAATQTGRAAAKGRQILSTLNHPHKRLQ